MKFSTIINSTPFQTYQNVLKFTWTAASAKVGQTAAKKLGFEKKGQAVGAAMGVVGYSALLAKCEQLEKKNHYTNQDIADWMDSVRDEAGTKKRLGDCRWAFFFLFIRNLYGF